MFWQSYKNTFRTLFRTGLFLAMAALVVGMTIRQAISGYRVSDHIAGFVVDADTYIQLVGNMITPMLWDSMLFFIIVSVMLILNRDYGDSFFEVERAGGITPASYFGGRIAALVSISVPFGLLMSFLGTDWYYFSRGGMEGMSLAAFWRDSSVRILRFYFLGAVPIMLMYLGVVCLVGCLLKSGFAGAVGGVILFVFHELCGTVLSLRMPSVYRFFNPQAFEKYVYLTYYDQHLVSNNSFTPTEFWLWFSVMLGFAAAGLAAAYLLTRKREI